MLLVSAAVVVAIYAMVVVTSVKVGEWLERRRVARGEPATVRRENEEPKAQVGRWVG
jgi:chorismate synthase